MNRKIIALLFGFFLSNLVFAWDVNLGAHGFFGGYSSVKEFFAKTEGNEYNYIDDSKGMSLGLSFALRNDTLDLPFSFLWDWEYSLRTEVNYFITTGQGSGCEVVFPDGYRTFTYKCDFIDIPLLLMITTELNKSTTDLFFFYWQFGLYGGPMVSIPVGAENHDVINFNTGSISDETFNCSVSPQVTFICGAFLKFPLRNDDSMWLVLDCRLGGFSETRFNNINVARRNSPGFIGISFEYDFQYVFF